ncbi:MAG: lysophospholipase [Bacteroidales bacterium]|nr:lysophospholipase [Bacteroidales bacterium]
MKIIKDIRLIALFTLLFCFTITSYAQPSGKWSGSINVSGQNIDFEVNLPDKNDDLGGVLNIPSQGAYGLELNSVKWDAPKFSFKVDTTNTHLVFEGKRKNDSIKGVFRQSGVQGTFYLVKATKKETPWVNKEITFKSGKFSIAASLSIPDTTGTYPGVVLVSGSGGQDRTENISGFKVFDKLASALLKNGIAVIRYDDRGTGASEGKDVMNYTTPELAKDAEAAFHKMISNEHVNSKQSGILGHSEGAIIAGEVARNNPEVDFILLMAGPAVRGDKLLLAQSESIMNSREMDDNYVKNVIELNKKMYSYLMKGKVNWKALRNKLWQGFASLKDTKELSSMDSTTINKQVNAQVKSMKKPWFRYFIKHNPREVYKEVNVPALALYGGKDSQVSARQNARAIEEMGKANFSIKLFPDANHLFQKAETGSPMEYGSLDKKFVAGFTDYIVKWIKER